MQLSNSSVIKSSQSIDEAINVIDTAYKNPNSTFEIEEISENSISINEYESLADTIIKNAKHKADSLILEATQKIAIQEKEAYENAYNQGKQNGYEDGYKEGQENIINKLTKEYEIKVNDMMEQSLEILRNAEDDYKAYMEEKQNIIEKTIFQIANKLAYAEIRKDYWVISILEPLLQDFRGEENLIIRCNAEHISDINDHLEEFRVRFSLKGEIFIVNDIRMEPGNVIIEKKSGRIEAGIDIAIEEIKKVLGDDICEAKND